MSYHARLIARLIFQKSASTAELIESAWTTTFAGSSITNIFNDTEGNPADLGTTADGTSGFAARRDHVPDLPALDTLYPPTDITTLNASTPAHGLVVKATAPAQGSNTLNVVGIATGETAYTNKTLFDSTNTADIGTAAAGTSLSAAHRDHVHALPATHISYALFVGSATFDPADSTTYYFACLPNEVPTITVQRVRLYCPMPGTIIAAEIFWHTYGGTAGSNENVSIYIRLNNTTWAISMPPMSSTTMWMSGSSRMSMSR